MARSADPFSATDRLPETALDVMVARLEVRGHHPYFSAALSQYLDRIGIDEAGEVLDLGCGTGIAARQIAQRPGFTGSVLGIDLSEHLVRAARRFADDEILTERARFEVGDCHDLKLAKGSFDAVVAHTLFSHVNDPVRVLQQVREVVRPGGVVAIFDGDFASMTFELADGQRSRRMDDAIIASLVANPRILRQLPRLLRQAGFSVEGVLPTVITEVGTADYWQSAIEAFTKLVPLGGRLTEADTAAWLEELNEASGRGEFFGSCVYYAYVVRPN